MWALLAMILMCCLVWIGELDRRKSDRDNTNPPSINKNKHNKSN